MTGAQLDALAADGSPGVPFRVEGGGGHGWPGKRLAHRLAVFFPSVRRAAHRLTSGFRRLGLLPRLLPRHHSQNRHRATSPAAREALTGIARMGRTGIEPVTLGL